MVHTCFARKHLADAVGKSGSTSPTPAVAEIFPGPFCQRPLKAEAPSAHDFYCRVIFLLLDYRIFFIYNFDKKTYRFPAFSLYQPPRSVKDIAPTLTYRGSQVAMQSLTFQGIRLCYFWMQDRVISSCRKKFYGCCRSKHILFIIARSWLGCAHDA